MLFLCFEVLCVVIIVLFAVQNFKSYQSELLEVTPDIRTPVPVGQYQHGSSRWLNNKEKDITFKTFSINPTNKEIKKLIKSGYDNLKFLREEKNNVKSSNKN